MSGTRGPEKVGDESDGGRALRLIGTLVPPMLRADWLREWAAEIAYDRRARTARGGRRAAGAVLSYAGAAEDALRLRLRRGRGSGLAHDLRFTIRCLIARPLWTTAVTGTLALGIGATVTIFSLVYGVLLQPLPFDEPGRLLVVTRELTFQLYEELRGQQEVFNDLGVWAAATRTVRIAEQPELLRGAHVNAALFAELGARPILGRVIVDADDGQGAAATVVLSHRLWTTRFAGDREVLGRTLTIDDQPHVIVGVMPEAFSFPSAGVLYWQSLANANRTPTTWYLHALGRVRSDLTVQQARAGVRVAELYDPSSDDGVAERVAVEAMPLHEFTSGSLRTSLLVFQGAVAAVLMIACLNVMNLVLSRAADREREVVVRAALGAGRSRLVRLAFTETTTLGLLGGVLGVGLAFALLRAVLAFLPDAVPLQERVAIRVPVLLVALALSLGAGVAVGLLPALRAGRLSIRNGLQDGARGFTESRTRQRLRKGLVAAQLALALTLLVGGGLLLRSFVALWSVDPGLEATAVAGVRIAVPENSYPGQAPKRLFYAGLLERIEAIPNVERASAAASFPFTGSYSTSTLQIEGYDHSDDESVRGEMQVVTPGYFETLGIPLLAGRDFTARDGGDSPVVIVSESVAKAYFPAGNAVGQRVRGLWQMDETWFTIVGVVGNIHHRGLDVATAHQIYAPYAVAAWPWTMAVTVRVDGEPLAPAGAIRDAVATLDRNIPAPGVFPLTRLLSNSVKQERFVTALLGAFAATALLLAAVGVYGVVACSVGHRTRELGIRMALGAHGARLTREVVLDGALMTIVGLSAGGAGAAALSSVLQSMLFNVDARDPAVFLAAAVSLLLVSLAASFLPARRAGKLDPVKALRGE